MRTLNLILPGLLLLTACASASTPAFAGAHDDHRVYHAERDAASDIAAALARAKGTDKLVLAVFGANWCHDSRGFAEHLEDPLVATVVAEHFEVAYVDVGMRDRNLGVAEIYGQPEVVGTPTLIVLSADGMRINSPEDATAWRNAHSRSANEVREALLGYVGKGRVALVVPSE